MASAAKIGMRRQALALFVAGGIEYGLQMMLPIVLVRHLDPVSFGQYRVLWLMASTAIAIAPACMPQTLYYFLPRGGAEQRGALVGNVIVYMCFASVLVGVFTGPWNPWLPRAFPGLSESHLLVPAFLAVWAGASVLDVLPTAEGRVLWQAGSMIGLAVFRTLLLALAAWLTSDLEVVLCALLVVAAIKVMALLFYIVSTNFAGELTMQRRLLHKQFLYSLPFAISSALFLLRVQADQWVVAAMFAPDTYAAFSIAAMVLSVTPLIRQPVNNLMLPRIGAAYSRGDSADIARFIAKSNGATALILLPVIGGLFVGARELVEILYTRQYLAAVIVMQVYLFGMVVSSFAIGHVLIAVGKGRFAAVSSFVCLLLSVVLSMLGAFSFGLPGAAGGSVLTLLIGEIWALMVVAKTIGVSVRHLFAGKILALILGATLAAASVTVVIFQQIPEMAVPLVLAMKAICYLAVWGVTFAIAGGIEDARSLLKGVRN